MTVFVICCFLIWVRYLWYRKRKKPITQNIMEIESRKQPVLEKDVAEIPRSNQKTPKRNMHRRSHSDTEFLFSSNYTQSFACT